MPDSQAIDARRALIAELAEPARRGAVEGGDSLDAAGTEDPDRARTDEREDDDDAEEVADELGSATGADHGLVDQGEGAGETA